MNLEIHKASSAKDDIRIEITEVFPDRYGEAEVASICETEAQALYDALRCLPTETKAALVRLIERGGLES